MRVPVALISVLAITVGVRAAALPARPLWFDEVLSWRIAKSPLAEWPAALRVSPHPPAYFLVLRCWVLAAGDDPTATRWPSVAAGAAGVLGLYLFTRRVTAAWGWATAHRAGLLAAALLALSPFHIRYSVEARMYALAAAFAVWTAWLLLRALDPALPRWRGWALYTAVAVPFAYTHYFAYLSLACQAAYAVWVCCDEVGGRWWRIARAPRFWPAAGSYGLVGVALLPWAAVLHGHLRTEAGARDWIPVLRSWDQLYSILYQILVNPEWLPSRAAGARVALAATAVLIAAAVRGPRPVGAAVVLAAGPIVLMAVAGAAGVRLGLARYLSVAQPFLLATVAVVTAGRPALVAGPAAAILLTASGWACADAWLASDWPAKPGCRGAAEYVALHRAPGEPVVVANGFTYLPFHVHSPDRTDVYALAAGPDGFLDGEHLMAAGELLPAERLRSWGGRRVWAVHSVGAGGPRTTVPMPSGWVVGERLTIPDALFGAVEVVRYDPAPHR